MTTCLHCSKEFVKASNVQKFCSKECLKAGRAPRCAPLREVVCTGCSTKFETTDPRKQFCSSPCRWVHANNSRPTSKTEIRNCVVCDKEFQPMQKTGPGRTWCSEACKHIMGGNPIRLAKMASGEADADQLKAASEWRRKWSLKKTFGLSIEQFNEMLEKQNGVCEICKQPESRKNGWNKKTRFLAVDHCHASGKIRGLLCSDCNTALGLFRDDTARIQAAIEYLKSHSENANEITQVEHQYAD